MNDLDVLAEKARRAPQNLEKTLVVTFVVGQHLYFWTSLSVLVGTAYIIPSTIADGSILVPNLLLIVTASLSLTYVGCNGVTSYMLCEAKEKGRDEGYWSKLRRLSNVFLRVSIAMWLIACGMITTFTVAKHASCYRSGTANTNMINVGTTCIIQRGVVAAGLLALPISILLFVLTFKIAEPMRYHMFHAFGVRMSDPELALTLPHKPLVERSTSSEMSFKCRSSISLSSKTDISPFGNSTKCSLPCRPEKSALGIFAQRSPAPSFLSPRPSLSSIRSHSKIGMVPSPSSPLPPLPPYFPQVYGRGSAMYTAIHPPRQLQKQGYQQHERTTQDGPPPALSIENLAVFNRSQDSLSSVYSQSLSGERYSVQLGIRPKTLKESSRSYSSGSTATMKRSPLGIMRLVEHPDVIIADAGGNASSNGSSESDIDDAITLQAKLPCIKAVSAFGDVEDWICGSQVAAEYYQSLLQLDDGVSGVTSRPMSLKGFLVRRTKIGGVMPR